MRGSLVGVAKENPPRVVSSGGLDVTGDSRLRTRTGISVVHASPFRQASLCPAAFREGGGPWQTVAGEPSATRDVVLAWTRGLRPHLLFTLSQENPRAAVRILPSSRRPRVQPRTRGALVVNAV